MLCSMPRASASQICQSQSRSSCKFTVGPPESSGPSATIRRRRTMAQRPQQIGSPVSRVEGRDKVTGRALYTADTASESVTYGALVQSEIPHGVVTAESLRASAERAAAAPGVAYVLTPLNCPVLQVLPRSLTFDFPLERRPPLSD